MSSPEDFCTHKDNRNDPKITTDPVSGSISKNYKVSGMQGFMTPLAHCADVNDGTCGLFNPKFPIEAVTGLEEFFTYRLWKRGVIPNDKLTEDELKGFEDRERNRSR